MIHEEPLTDPWNIDHEMTGIRDNHESLCSRVYSPFEPY
jgi:hypothetical protein